MLSELRSELHQEVCAKVLRMTKAKTESNTYPNLSDANNKSSVRIGWNLVELLGCDISQMASEPERRNEGAETGIDAIGLVSTAFGNVCRDFVGRSFELLTHLRPGSWKVARNAYISEFDQYTHLADFAEVVRLARKEGSQAGRLLEQLLGRDYIVKPDIIVARAPVTDEEVNQQGVILLPEDQIAELTPLRSANRKSAPLILHASISCKWTVRSDRSQNTRTEALNLIRNRKGNLPHVVAITAEPLPTRIASLAQGTGDMDCVYHFALPELRQAVKQAEAEDQLEMLDELIGGRRLRDIADLPFDLAI